jgi:hypothetical protein
MQERIGTQAEVAHMPASKSALKRMKRLGRRVSRSARTFVRFVAVLAAALAVVVYWNAACCTAAGLTGAAPALCQQTRPIPAARLNATNIVRMGVPPLQTRTTESYADAVPFRKAWARVRLIRARGVVGKPRPAAAARRRTTRHAPYGRGSRRRSRDGGGWSARRD